MEKVFETPNVSDETLIILNEKQVLHKYNIPLRTTYLVKINEIQKHKYERNTFRPWETTKDPPWGVWKRLFQTPYMCQMSFSLS